MALDLNQGAGLVLKSTASLNASSQMVAEGASEQVNTAVAEMDKVVQQNAANAEESVSASEEMSQQAQHMINVVEELQSLVINAKAGAPGAPPAPSARWLRGRFGKIAAADQPQTPDLLDIQPRQGDRAGKRIISY